jgi:hypothetical protein
MTTIDSYVYEFGNIHEVLDKNIGYIIARILYKPFPLSICTLFLQFSGLKYQI